MSEKPTCEPVGVPKTTKSVPITRNTSSASTLTRANQNSSSPKIFTETRFSASTSTTTTRASAHCGIPTMNSLYCPNHAM